MRFGRRRVREVVGLACVGVLFLAGCSGDESSPDAAEDGLVPTLAEPSDEAVVVPGGDAAALSAGLSAALYDSAPVVVLASETEQLRAASAAAALGVPALIDGPDVAAEIQRLGAETALVIGTVADPGIDVVVAENDEQLAELIGVESAPVPVPQAEAATRVAALDPAGPQLLIPDAGQLAPPADLESDEDELPATTTADPATSITVMSTAVATDVAALGTARAAGAQVLISPNADPRASSESVQAIAQSKPATVIGLGAPYGDSASLAQKVRTAATGVELPGGGQLALPGKTYVALYGSPGTGALGVLGEQPIEKTIERAEEHASWYVPLVPETVVPTLEIIVTVASASATPDGNYSNELPIEEIKPLVDLAEQNGQYVILDLQPGRTDFLTQAKMYEELLLRPNVGLALDPEWRLGPNEKHLVQVGSVPVDEVNQVVTYLADLTAAHNLPQKVLVLHMFQVRMIPGVDTVDQSRDELAVLIHVDGQGSQPAKQGTWGVLHQNAPSIQFWGWKNFYDEDKPMLTPQQTIAQVNPTPDFISYQ